MSIQLVADFFFELAHFTHRSLWDSTDYVWEGLAKLKEYLAQLPLGHIAGDVSPQAYLVHPETISIGAGTIVEPGAYIRGPCVIGENCQIRHGAYIRGHCLTGDHVVIGHATEVKHSILFDHAQAGHFAYLGDSILGNHVNLGAGVKCANLRLDGHPISICLPNEKISTHQRKLGGIIGDRAQIGCNAVLNPGTLILPDAFGYPNSTLKGIVSASR